MIGVSKLLIEDEIGAAHERWRCTIVLLTNESLCV